MGTIWPLKQGHWSELVAADQSNLISPFSWKRQPLVASEPKRERDRAQLIFSRSRRWRGSTSVMSRRWQASGSWSQLSQRPSSRIVSCRGRWTFVLCRSYHPPRKWSSCQSSKSAGLNCAHTFRSVLITCDLGTDSLHVWRCRARVKEI